MAIPTPKVTKSLRELSCVLNSGTAARVLEILRRNLKELGDEQYRLGVGHLTSSFPTKKQQEEYARRSRDLEKSIVQMNAFVQMFEDIRWAQDSSQPAFYRRALNASNDRYRDVGDQA